MVNGDTSEVSIDNNNDAGKVNGVQSEEYDNNSLTKHKKEEDHMNNVNANTIIAEIEVETKKKRWYGDKAYYIAKELLMTELTYKKDLEVINLWFRNDVGREEPNECGLLLSLTAPLAAAHSNLVRDLELRLQSWEGRGGPKTTEAQRIGDVLLTHLPPLITLYEEYLDGHLVVLEKLDSAFKQNNCFEQLYREFEMQKVCYLPLTSFILKPLHRLLHYQYLLERLMKHYDESHPDLADCRTASATLSEILTPVVQTLPLSENAAALCELQREIVGFDNIIQVGRKFVRHGCLLKMSRKGYQQRMFFLFSDILLYTSRAQTTLQYKVHGYMPLRGVMLEEPEGNMASFAFIIYGGTRALTVAANSQYEKEKWIEDLTVAINAARDRSDSKLTYLSLKSCNSSEEVIDQCGNEFSSQTAKSSASQRNNTCVHVCWHRNTSVGLKDQLTSVENQLSGYLLRKFKSSNGWQKLWVVYTSFCLFFYKSCMDDFSLACLPLLGYTIGAPAPEDNIVKDFVFKLQYKNHVYFFRAESEYTYNRWLEVIRNTTQNNSKARKNYSNENSIESSPVS